MGGFLLLSVSVCRKVTFTVGPVEGAGGDQPPIEVTKTICKFVSVALPESDCLGEVDPETGECGGGGPGEGGYDYPDTPEPDDPCEKMKAQNNNIEYKAKITELKKPSILNKKKEKGYSESKSGIFNPLEESQSTGSSDGLKVPVTADTKGYVHTHLNDYEKGNDDDGNPVIRQPIRMFSPADVNTLMTMAGFVTDGNYSELYGTMVSSYGIYTIKFTGTPLDIKTGFDTQQWKDDFITYRKDNPYWSFEKLFLNFLKDKMNVQGVELYKINTDGTIEKKTVNSNKEVESNNCPQ